MKYFLIMAAVCVVLFMGFGLYVTATDPMTQMYRDRTEYPLESVVVEDDSEYMLVKWQHSPAERYEVITDTAAIKANVSAFSVDNDGTIYGTTADGTITLYRDGEAIDTVLFDHTYTKKIEYGTLAFQPINELQLQLLHGCEFVEKEKHYSVLRKDREEPYYYFFAHGEDIEAVDTVYRLGGDTNPGKLPQAQDIGEGLVEYIEYSTNYAGQQQRHWFLRKEDGMLSRWYWSVKDVQGTRIVRPATYMDGGPSAILLHDMFDPLVDFQRITGDFPEPRDDYFLLSAAFEEDGTLLAEYTGKDGETHSKTFVLE